MSYQNYLKTVKKRQQEALQAVAKFMEALGLDNRALKEKAAAQAIRELKELRTIVDPVIPDWLNQLIALLEAYINNGEHGAVSYQTISAVGKLYEMGVAHQWTNLESDHIPIVLEDLANEVYGNSRVPTLFESLAQSLERLITEKAIDSNDAITRLKELIRLIRANARKGYFTASYLVPLAFSIVKHTFKHVVKEKLGPLGEGIKDALNEMAEEWPRVEKEVNAKFGQVLEVSFPSLGYAPEESVIDAESVIVELKIEPPRIEHKPEAGESEALG